MYRLRLTLLIWAPSECQSIHIYEVGARTGVLDFPGREMAWEVIEFPSDRRCIVGNQGNLIEGVKHTSLCPDVEQFSSFTRMLRAKAQVLRFIR